MSLLKKLFNNEKKRSNEQISKEFTQCRGNTDLWSWLAKFSTDEIENFCASFSFNSINLSQKKLLTDDKLDPRFQLVCFLVNILLVYDKLLSEKPELKLPPSLPASQIADILITKILTFMRTQNTGEMAIIYKKALVGLASELMRAGKDHEALELYLLSYPSPDESHYLGILGCRFNIATTTKTNQDIDAAIESVNKVLNREIKVPPHGISLANNLLVKLRELKGENFNETDLTPEACKKILKEFTELKDSEYNDLINTMTVGPGEDAIMKAVKAAMQSRERAYSKISQKYKLSEDVLNSIINENKT